MNYCTNIINKNFQMKFESEGLRTQKISYYDNKKTVDLLLNVSFGFINSVKIINIIKALNIVFDYTAFNIQIGHLGLPTN